MNLDDLIANSNFGTGPFLEVQRRRAAYTLDGNRLGGVDYEFRTESQHDPRLSDKRFEIEMASLVLALLGYERVSLFSVNADGEPLERPDLEAEIDGARIGVEVAQAISEKWRKISSVHEFVERNLLDRRDTNSAFAQALGNYYVIVALGSPGGPESKPASKTEGKLLLGELIEFIESGGHKPATEEVTPFPSTSPRLHSLGATFSSSKQRVGTISVGGGPRFLPSAPDVTDVTRVLNDHRESAKDYRTSTTWIILVLSDMEELFRATLLDVEKRNPEIKPFAKCYLLDAAYRIVELPKTTPK